MTPLLICEGSCNPQLDKLDNAVRALRRGQRLSDGHWYYPAVGPIADTAVVAQLRGLKHTRHARQSPTTHKCMTCGTERRY